jgi:hypothetical protein
MSTATSTGGCRVGLALRGANSSEKFLNFFYFIFLEQKQALSTVSLISRIILTGLFIMLVLLFPNSNYLFK